MTKKKKVFKIFLANQKMWDGTFHLGWGTKTVNTHNKRFRSYKAAIKFKNALAKKWKKKGYKIDYLYAVD